MSWPYAADVQPINVTAPNSEDIISNINFGNLFHIAIDKGYFSMYIVIVIDLLTLN